MVVELVYRQEQALHMDDQLVLALAVEPVQDMADRLALVLAEEQVLQLVLVRLQAEPY